MAKKAAEAVRTRARGGCSVLVVDDEPDLSSLIAELLGAHGYRVVTAENGRAALDRLSRASFDIILSDFRMPEMDGPGLYRELERQHPHLVSRLVFMTGNAFTDDTADFFAATGAPCLRKPFEREDVQRVFEQVLTPVH
ncbi:MAG: response regulator [Candidatus Rokuibacteriota bacterium]